jgi:hypothetical protein
MVLGSNATALGMEHALNHIQPKIERRLMLTCTLAKLKCNNAQAHMAQNA